MFGFKVIKLQQESKTFCPQLCQSLKSLRYSKMFTNQDVIMWENQSLLTNQVGVGSNSWNLIQKHLHLHKFENSGGGLKKLIQPKSIELVSLNWKPISSHTWTKHISLQDSVFVSPQFGLPCSLQQREPSQWSMVAGWFACQCWRCLAWYFEDERLQTVHIHPAHPFHVWNHQKKSWESSNSESESWCLGIWMQHVLLRCRDPIRYERGKEWWQYYLVWRWENQDCDEQPDWRVLRSYFTPLLLFVSFLEFQT